MRKFLLLLTFLAAANMAWAQRTLPANAKRAEIGTQQMLPMVMLNQEAHRLAPGGLIFDAANRRITHGQLRPGSEVIYELDRNGEILRIVVLTPEEEARFDRAKK
jgi:hypothetical protein